MTVTYCCFWFCFFFFEKKKHLNEVIFFSRIQKAITLIPAADQYFGSLSVSRSGEKVHEAQKTLKLFHYLFLARKNNTYPENVFYVFRNQ